MIQTEIVLCGKTIKVSCKNENGATCEKWGGRRNRFAITISVEGVEDYKTPYYDSIANYPKPLNEDGLKNALYCVLSDASCCRSSRDLDDFISEMGYEDYKEGERAYRACEIANGFFNECDIDVYQALEELDM